MSLTRTGHRTGAFALVVALALAPLLATMVSSAGAVPKADSGALLTWASRNPASSPPARVHAAVAFDAATGTTVLFGGRSGSTVLGDTWTWDGTTWTAQTPSATPPPLESASLAYDGAGQRIVLFGGIGSDGTASNQTWAWTGTTWAQLAPATTPPARYGASIASDGATNTVVLFGGLSAPGMSQNDTWSWDGANWTEVTPATSPPARSDAAMTFDALRGVVVLFGGVAGSDDQADTWTWDGTNWSQLHPATSPPARSDAAFGFDPGTEQAVLFGGTGAEPDAALRDTWLWNGSTWSTSLPLTLLPALSPPARFGAALAGAPTRLVLFGGQSGGANPAALGDTWAVGTVAAIPPTTTTTTSRPATTTTVAGATTPPPTTAGTSTTVAPAAPSTTPRPPAKPALAVAAGSIRRGDSVRVSGSGFVPGATITITFHSPRVVVATTTADAQGRFSTSVVVPADAEVGEHHIEAVGAAKTGGQAVLVAQVSVARPPSRNTWLLPAFMVALTVLLAAGAGVVLTASARRQHHRLA